MEEKLHKSKSTKIHHLLCGGETGAHARGGHRAQHPAFPPAALLSFDLPNNALYLLTGFHRPCSLLIRTPTRGFEILAKTRHKILQCLQRCASAFLSSPTAHGLAPGGQAGAQSSACLPSPHHSLICPGRCWSWHGEWCHGSGLRA